MTTVFRVLLYALAAIGALNLATAAAFLIALWRRDRQWRRAYLRAAPLPEDGHRLSTWEQRRLDRIEHGLETGPDGPQLARKLRSPR